MMRAMVLLLMVAVLLTLPGRKRRWWYAHADQWSVAP
jgi:hypothetical protein